MTKIISQAQYNTAQDADPHNWGRIVNAVDVNAVDPAAVDASASSNASLISAPTVTVVIPAKNEAKNLPHVLPKIPSWVHEVLLVDGDSTDDTIAVAREIMPTIRVVAQDGPGKGAALRTGFHAATGDIIVMIDADGSMDPNEILIFVGALLTGADFAKGSRFLQGGGTYDMSYLRFLGNWGLTRLVSIIFGGKFSDLCYGYNAFWRRILPALDLDADGFEIETLMNVRALKARLKVAEVPSFEDRRIYGVSNLNTFRDGWRVLKTIIRERLQRQPLHRALPANKPAVHNNFIYPSTPGRAGAVQFQPPSGN